MKPDLAKYAVYFGIAFFAGIAPVLPEPWRTVDLSFVSGLAAIKALGSDPNKK